MKREDLELMHQVFTKYLPTMDNNLIRSILIALYLMADQEKGEEIKHLVEKYIADLQ